MGVSDQLTNEIKGIAMVVIIVIVFSIVLIKFKDVDGVTSNLNISIDTSVAALDEPITWIAIIIIIIVVAWLMKYMKAKNSM